jgi:hypothetical protein
MSRHRLRHARVCGRLGMFCPRVYRTSGSLGALPLGLLCWLCIGGLFFCCLPCVFVLVGGLLVMLLAPLLRCGCFRVCAWSRVFVPPTFHSCSLLAAGLFRVEHQSPFVSLGNAALATYPTTFQVSHLGGLGAPALPTFPCVTPTQCNPVCGLGRI